MRTVGIHKNQGMVIHMSLLSGAWHRPVLQAYIIRFLYSVRTVGIYKNQIMMVRTSLVTDFGRRLIILQGYDFRVPIIPLSNIQVCFCEPSYFTFVSTLNMAPLTEGTTRGHLFPMDTFLVDCE